MNVDTVQPPSATKPGLDVVMVGAGIAGLTAALTICKLANRVTLLRRRGRPKSVPESCCNQMGWPSSMG